MMKSLLAPSWALLLAIAPSAVAGQECCLLDNVNIIWEKGDENFKSTKKRMVVNSDDDKSELACQCADLCEGFDTATLSKHRKKDQVYCRCVTGTLKRTLESSKMSYPVAVMNESVYKQIAGMKKGSGKSKGACDFGAGGPAPLEEWEKELDLGPVTFTGLSAKHELSRTRFNNGLLALLTFYYDLATDEFNKCIEGEPTFVMCHWGLAMTMKMPLWSWESREGAQEIFARLDKMGFEASQHELAHLNALRIRFGPGSLAGRHNAYQAALEALVEEYPDDVDAMVMLALVMLDQSDALEPAANAKIREVIDKALELAPNSAGPIHVLAHFLDTPTAEITMEDVAIIDMLPEVAPSAGHAIHMPTHVYDRLGWWKSSTEMNQRSWDSCTDYCDGRGLDYTCNKWDRYHALEFGAHGLHQRGMHEEAAEKVVLMHEYANWAHEAGETGLFYYQVYVRMWARSVFETLDCDAPPLLDQSGAEMGIDRLPVQGGSGFYDNLGEISALLARAFLHGKSCRPDNAEVLKMFHEQQFDAIGERMGDNPYWNKLLPIWKDMFTGLVDRDAEILRAASNAMAELPFSPTDPTLPVAITPHDAAGLVLMEDESDYEGALDAFTTGLERWNYRRLPMELTIEAAISAGDPAEWAEEWRAFEDLLASEEFNP